MPPHGKILARAPYHRTHYKALATPGSRHRACTMPCVMDPITAIAASGLRARMESLDLLANNIANASTSGYKADREFYSLYSAAEAQDDPLASMPVIERPWTDLGQGSIHATNNPLDVALTGKGFFSVNGPSGPLYTRTGNFRMAPDGKLVTSDGYPLRNTQGTAVTLESGRDIEISNDGTVRQAGQVICQLELADFASTAGLAKQGNSYFRVTDPSLSPRTPAGTAVEQGKLEDSNTGSAEGAVRLVSVMRQFEMLQKAAALGSEMSRHAIQEVAKVG
jgi:flagellar basal-body rod protein FlgF